MALHGAVVDAQGRRGELFLVGLPLTAPLSFTLPCSNFLVYVFVLVHINKDVLKVVRATLSDSATYH